MGDEGTPQLSEEESRLLRHEAFIARVLGFRRRPGEEGGFKPPWQRFLESAGGAAFVTVLFGSIAAGLINSWVQDTLKQRELALAAYREELKQQEEIGARVVDLVGSSIAAAEDLIVLTSEPFDYKRFSGSQRSALIDQRTRMRKHYNEVDSEWRRNHAKVGLMIAMHTRGRQDVHEKWKTLAEAVAAYKTCAESWYYAHMGKFVTSNEAKKACRDTKPPLGASLEQFIAHLTAGSAPGGG